MKEQALAYLSRNPLAYIDMIAPIQRGSGELIAVTPGGVLLLEQVSNTHMIAASDDRVALELLEHLTAPTLMCVHNQAAAIEAAKRFGLTLTLTCHQALWTKPQPPEIPTSTLEIRLLDARDAEVVNRIYSHNIGLEYIEKRLNSREVWGAFDGDALAGFIGCHAEGSMGLLEVLPQYRRHGIGKLLAAFLVNEMMKKGVPAFSQFSRENEASRRLNMALGMEISAETLYWLE